MLTSPSDEQNPEVAAKQIISITPILQGQQVSHEFDIPPRSPSKDQATGGSGNLIDFGDENAAPTASGPSQAQNAGSQGALLDLQDHGASNNGSGLMAPLQPSQSQQPGNPIRRKDTNTNELEEFVDAEEK